MADVRLATVAAFQHMFETDELLHGLVRRQALKDWVDLLAVSHPLDRWAVFEAIHVIRSGMSKCIGGSPHVL